MSFEINNRRYTGSKTKIVNWIADIIEENCHDCKSFCDLFAGTGVVTNKMITRFNKFYINDFLYSNELIYNAFFKKQNYSLEKIVKFSEKYKNLNSDNIKDNFISVNYGNKFFEFKDALLIGYIREDLEKNRHNLNKREFDILLASLLYSADRCANTVGHYEAYCKKGKLRSSFRFELIKPVIIDNNDEREINITRCDSNELVKKVTSDIVYIDPPYSSRQYSRFYHVLETIVKWDNPELYGVALKPKPENMSAYCSSKAIDSFTELIANIKAKYIIVSYNNTYNSKSKSSENKMSLEDITNVLNQKGTTKIFSISHQAFNAGKTELDDHKELLFLTEVGVFND